MTLGGMTGFAIGGGIALAQECAWSSAIWRGSVAACVTGLLLKWWWQIWVRGLHQVQTEKLKAEIAAQKQTAAQTKT